MAEHLRYEGAVVEAKTTPGAFTCELLDLNAPSAVKQRSLILEIIQHCQTTKAELLQLKKAINKKRVSGTATKSTAGADLEMLDAGIKKMEAIVTQLAGVN
jgi:hypothetical protein